MKESNEFINAVTNETIISVVRHVFNDEYNNLPEGDRDQLADGTTILGFSSGDFFSFLVNTEKRGIDIYRGIKYNESSFSDKLDVSLNSFWIDRKCKIEKVTLEQDKSIVYRIQFSLTNNKEVALLYDEGQDALVIYG